MGKHISLHGCPKPYRSCLSGESQFATMAGHAALKHAPLWCAFQSRLNELEAAEPSRLRGIEFRKERLEREERLKREERLGVRPLLSHPNTQRTAGNWNPIAF